jgi:hypothetical protein
MNLIAAAEASLLERVLLFLLYFVPSVALIIYFIVKSKQLSEVLEALSDERLSSRAKLDSLVSVWRNRRGPST